MINFNYNKISEKKNAMTEDSWDYPFTNKNSRK